MLVNKTPPYLRLVSAPRLGVCRTPLWDTAEETTKHAVEDAAKRLAAAGASVKEIVLPEEFSRALLHGARDHQQLRALEDMAADWQHHPAKISKVLGDRVKKGFAMKHEDYVAALAACRTLPRAHRDAYDGIDAIISPCVKGEAPGTWASPANRPSSSSGRC